MKSKISGFLLLLVLLDQVQIPVAHASDEKISLTRLGPNLYSLDIQGQYEICGKGEIKARGFEISHSEWENGTLSLLISDSLPSQFCHLVRYENASLSFRIFLADESILDGDTLGEQSQLIKGKNYTFTINKQPLGVLSVETNGNMTLMKPHKNQITTDSFFTVSGRSENLDSSEAAKLMLQEAELRCAGIGFARQLSATQYKTSYGYRIATAKFDCNGPVKNDR